MSIVGTLVKRELSAFLGAYLEIVIPLGTIRTLAANDMVWLPRRTRSVIAWMPCRDSKICRYFSIASFVTP